MFTLYQTALARIRGKEQKRTRSQLAKQRKNNLLTVKPPALKVAINVRSRMKLEVLKSWIIAQKLEKSSVCLFS